MYSIIFYHVLKSHCKWHFCAHIPVIIIIIVVVVVVVIYRGHGASPCSRVSKIVLENMLLLRNFQYIVQGTPVSSLFAMHIAVYNVFTFVFDYFRWFLVDSDVAEERFQATHGGCVINCCSHDVPRRANFPLQWYRCLMLMGTVDVSDTQIRTANICIYLLAVISNTPMLGYTWKFNDNSK